MDGTQVPVPVSGTEHIRQVSKTGCPACNPNLVNGVTTLCPQHAQRHPRQLVPALQTNIPWPLLRPGRARVSSGDHSDQLGLKNYNAPKTPLTPNDVGSQPFRDGTSSPTTARTPTSPAGAKSSIGSPPTSPSSSPRSPRGHSPSFSTSPTSGNGYSAWSTPGAGLRTPGTAWRSSSPTSLSPTLALPKPEPTPYRDITQLRVNNIGRGCM